MKKKIMWQVTSCLIMVALLLVSCVPVVTQEEEEEVAPPKEEEVATSAPEETPASTATPTMEKLRVHFIDVGQGDSILVDLGEMEILIDGGGKSPGVTAYLNDYVDGQLEVIVATHPHADHIGGLIAVLDAFDVQEIWHNGDSSTSQTYAQFMAAMQSGNAEVHIAKLHDTIEVDGLSFYVHHPSRTFDSINNNSIVIHLAYGNIDFLFTGDAEKEAEEAIMSVSSVRIPEVDILKVGHHGSRTASSKAFLAITSPEVAIYMAMEGNSYGHPHEETITALSEIGTEIYGTDVHGSIVITSDGEAYELQLEKQAPPVTEATESSPLPEESEQPSHTDTPEQGKAVNVQITRIFYDGQVSRVESDEYVEITNLGTEPVDLTGWVLKDISEGYPSFTFPSYVLQPGKSARIYTNEIHPEYGGLSFGYGKAIWNNTDPDTAALYNAQGQEVSRKGY
ncbi:lamin tail domain-containing protein [Chloroflexota bacterium]